MSFNDLSSELLIHILTSCLENSKIINHVERKVAAQNAWAACLRVNQTLHHLTAPILYRSIIVPTPLTLLLGTSTPLKESTKSPLLSPTRRIPFIPRPRPQSHPQCYPHDRQLLDDLQDILKDKLEVTPHLDYISFRSDSKVGYHQELKKLFVTVCKPRQSWCQTTIVNCPDTEIHIQDLPHNRDDDQKIDIEGQKREEGCTDLSGEEADWPLLSISWGKYQSIYLGESIILVRNGFVAK
ncbi:hypothetical protein V866_005217 [Kwoniella sp. B9012]